jgi:hypothetical protein
MAVFNDAVQRVRRGIVSAAGDAVTRSSYDSGMDAFASVGLYKLNPVDPYTLKPPGFNHCTYQVRNWFQDLPSKSNLYRYTSGSRGGASKLLPSEFIAAGAAAASLHSAGANRVDVQLTILDGAKLPPFPSIPTNATARLQSYLSDLNPSQAPPPGAVAASFAKVGLYMLVESS